MRALFGLGMHPDAETIITAYQQTHLRAGMSDEQLEQVNADANTAASLGRAFLQYAALESFADRVAARLTAIGEQTARAPTPVEVSKVKAEEARREQARDELTAAHHVSTLGPRQRNRERPSS